MDTNRYESPESLFKRMIGSAFTEQHLPTVDAIVSPNIVEHQSGMGIGPAGVKAAITYLHEVFPDFTLTLEDWVVSGNTIWGRSRARGTHTGSPHMGRPANGKFFEMYVFDICRFEKGLMVEHWGVPDKFAIMEQLGMVSPPASPTV